MSKVYPFNVIIKKGIDKLAYETVKLEIDLSDNEYKSKDFHIEVAKRSEPSTLLEI